VKEFSPTKLPTASYFQHGHLLCDQGLQTLTFRSLFQLLIPVPVPMATTPVTLINGSSRSRRDRRRAMPSLALLCFFFFFFCVLAVILLPSGVQGQYDENFPDLCSFDWHTTMTVNGTKVRLEISSLLSYPILSILLLTVLSLLLKS